MSKVHDRTQKEIQDLKFLEAFKNCRLDILANITWMKNHGMNRSDYIIDDIDECIKILEARKEK